MNFNPNMNNQNQEPNIDQVVDARASQRMALTFGGVMIDKIRAEEEVQVLHNRIAQLSQQILQLQTELEEEKAKALPVKDKKLNNNVMVDQTTT